MRDHCLLIREQCRLSREDIEVRIETGPVPCGSQIDIALCRGHGILLLFMLTCKKTHRRESVFRL